MEPNIQKIMLNDKTKKKNEIKKKQTQVNLLNLD